MLTQIRLKGLKDAALEESVALFSQHAVGVPIDLEPLPALLGRLGRARVQILNWRPRGELLEKLAKTSGIFFDTARVEGTDGVPQLVEKVGKDRVMFGSHAPFLIPEAALIRVHESSRLAASSLRRLLAANARRLAGKGD